MKIYIITAQERGWEDGDSEGVPEVLAVFSEDHKAEAEEYYKALDAYWRNGGLAFPGTIIMTEAEVGKVLYAGYGASRVNLEQGSPEVRELLDQHAQIQKNIGY